MALGVAIGWVLAAVYGLFFMAAILFSGTPVRGFTSEFLWLDVPTLVLIALSGVTIWQIMKLLSARGMA